MSERIIRAVHGKQDVVADPEFEVFFSQNLSSRFDRNALLVLYQRYAIGVGEYDTLLRRVFWRALTKSMGNGVHIGAGVGFKHIETFELGDKVFIGDQTYIQGRFDGTCIIGNHVWIGPQCYFDARDMVIGDSVGIGPGTKVLGSTHTALPVDIPIMHTDLVIKPVHIGSWSDLGVNCVIMPGVKLGQGCIVGAGAVVTKDVPTFAIVAGVPAKFIRWRDGYTPEKEGYEK